MNFYAAEGPARRAFFGAATSHTQFGPIITRSTSSNQMMAPYTQPPAKEICYRSVDPSDIPFLSTDRALHLRLPRVPFQAVSRVVAKLPSVVSRNRFLARGVFHARGDGGGLRRRSRPLGLRTIRAAPACPWTDVLSSEPSQACRRAACCGRRRGRNLWHPRCAIAPRQETPSRLKRD
jgi:hypothetical protein